MKFTSNTISVISHSSSRTLWSSLLTKDLLVATLVHRERTWYHLSHLGIWFAAWAAATPECTQGIASSSFRAVLFYTWYFPLFLPCLAPLHFGSYSLCLDFFISFFTLKGWKQCLSSSPKLPSTPQSQPQKRTTPPLLQLKPSISLHTQQSLMLPNTIWPSSFSCRSDFQFCLTYFSSSF